MCFFPIPLQSIKIVATFIAYMNSSLSSILLETVTDSLDPMNQNAGDNEVLNSG